MTYILLWFAVNSAVGTMTSGSAEFNSMASCNHAAQQMQKISKDRARTVCVEQGNTFP